MTKEEKIERAKQAETFLNAFKNGLESRLEKAKNQPQDSFALFYYQHVISTWLKALNLVDPAWINGFNKELLSRNMKLLKLLSDATGQQLPLIMHPIKINTKYVLASYSPIISLIKYLIDKLKEFVSKFPNVKIANKHVSNKCREAITSMEDQYKVLRSRHHKLNYFAKTQKKIEVLVSRLTEAGSDHYQQFRVVKDIIECLESKDCLLAITTQTGIPNDKLKHKHAREASYLPLIIKYFNEESKAIIDLVICPRKTETRTLTPQASALIEQAAIILQTFPKNQDNHSTIDDLQAQLDTACSKHGLKTSPWIDLSLYPNASTQTPIDQWILATLKQLGELYWEIIKHRKKSAFRVGTGWMKRFVKICEQLTLGLTPDLDTNSKATIVMTQALKLEKLFDDTVFKFIQLDHILNRLIERIMYDEDTHSMLWQIIPKHIYMSVSVESTDIEFQPSDELASTLHQWTWFLLLFVNMSHQEKLTLDRMKTMQAHVHHFFGQLMSLSMAQSDRPYNVRRAHIISVLEDESMPLMMMRLRGQLDPNLWDMFTEKLLEPMKTDHFQQRFPLRIEAIERPRALTLPSDDPNHPLQQADSRHRSQSLLSRAAHRAAKRLRGEKKDRDKNKASIPKPPRRRSSGESFQSAPRLPSSNDSNNRRGSSTFLAHSPTSNQAPVATPLPAP